MGSFFICLKLSHTIQKPQFPTFNYLISLAANDRHRSVNLDIKATIAVSLIILRLSGVLKYF